MSGWRRLGSGSSALHQAVLLALLTQVTGLPGCSRPAGSVVCGNGVVEPPETCDGDCPASCDDGDPCTADTTIGSAEACDLRCLHEPINACQGGDGCCPAGGRGACHALNDPDCAPLCPNGVVEPPETCDGDCPASCNDFDPCTTDTLTGDATGCDASCLYDQVVACQGGDGCCPGEGLEGCNALNDSDCAPLCPNGVTEPPEACDGDCPASCDDSDHCTIDSQTGSEVACDLECQHEPVACLSGDGCCPGGGMGACHSLNDSDCAPICGNGVPETQEECDDGNTVDWDGCTACAITEFQVNTDTMLSQLGGRVAMAPDGRFVIVWYGADVDRGGVRAQRFDSSGQNVGGELQVNTYTTDDQSPTAVAMAEDGRFVVSWISIGQDGSYDGTFAQRFDPDGNPVGPELQVNTFTQGDQRGSVLMAADGRFFFQFNSCPRSTITPSQDGDGCGVFGRFYSADGVPLGAETQINSYTLGQQQGTAVMTADGTVLSVWRSEGNYGYFARRFDGDGNSVGGEFQFDFDLPTPPPSPPLSFWNSIAMTADGSFLGYRGGRDADSSSGIRAQLFSADGIPVSPYLQVNTYTMDRQELPQAAMAPDGRFVVVWQSCGWTHAGQDGDECGVFGQRFDPDGNPVEGEFQVNVYTTDNQYGPTTTMVPDGSFIVVWMSDGQDSSDYGIFAQRYDPDGNPLGRGP